MKQFIFTFFLILWGYYTARGEISVAHIFKSDMVLQRGTDVSIWGWGDPEEEVKINIGNDLYQGTTKSDGCWYIKIGPYKAGGPYNIKISGKNQLVLNNV